MGRIKLVFAGLAVIVFLAGCSMIGLEGDQFSEYPGELLIIVEKGIYDDIPSSISQYRDDLSSGGTGTEVIIWEEGTYIDLQDKISSYAGTAEAAFLIGDLPAAWYEQTSFGNTEKFPCDLYFMCSDAVWTDTDNNGILDSHSPLTVDLYISRINGTTIELESYFEKLHEYRTGSLGNKGNAFIFKDDDWFNNYRGSTFGLDKLFPDIKTNDSADSTVRSNYIDSLQTETIDYVYQWIHAYPKSLYIINNESYEQITINDIGDHINGVFYNMFNCSGARFTESNLGMTYLMKTESGLGVMGSTKVGGNYYPLEFHRVLALGGCWGSAYKSWYNNYGSGDDNWFLGMVILGDPTLTIQSSASRGISMKSLSSIIPPADEEKEILYQSLINFREKK